MSYRHNRGSYFGGGGGEEGVIFGGTNIKYFRM